MDNRYHTLIPPILFTILLVLVWSGWSVELEDPWYRAAGVIDSAARKIEDPLLKKQMIERGGSDILRLHEQHPYHPRVTYLAAFYYLNVGQLDRAIELADDAIDKGKGGLVNQIEFEAIELLAYAIIRKTDSLYSLGAKKQALSLFDIGLKYFPNHKDLAFKKGSIYHSMGLIDSALYYYDCSFKGGGDNPILLNNAALILLDKGVEIADSDPKLALDYFQNGLNLLPENIELNYNTSMMLIRLDKFNEARFFLERAISLAPDNKSWIEQLNYLQNFDPESEQ